MCFVGNPTREEATKMRWEAMRKSWEEEEARRRKRSKNCAVEGGGERAMYKMMGVGVAVK